MKLKISEIEISDFVYRFRRFAHVVHALLRREEEIRRNAPAEAIVSLLEPVVMVATFSFLWWFLGRKEAVILGGSPVLFYATGFFAIYFFINLSGRMRRFMEVPRRRFPIEQRFDHIIVHIILRVIDYGLLGVLGFGVVYLFFSYSAMPYDFVPVIQACLAIVMLGFGWGVVITVVWQWSSTVGRIFSPLNRGIILVSGVFYIPDFLTPNVRHFLSYNPMLHAIALFRHGFYPNYPTLVLDVTYLSWCAVLMLMLGLVLERAMRRVESQ